MYCSMPPRPVIVNSDKPTYQILKWIGGGGCGQVFKVIRDGEILACKQIQVENIDMALQEYDHMALLEGGPHIATLRPGLDYNARTGTVSFFMDYYKGKDLDRQVQFMRGSREKFVEGQIIEIAYQIALALEYCHSKNVLHQDVKPMNVLLQDVWNPITQRDAPDLVVADFGISSHAPTIGTRFTSERGTRGYEAPEIRDQGQYSAFSAKSDIYAFGCILYRLCSLQDPDILDDIKPMAISPDYSIELLSLISTMLTSCRVDRPTATQVKHQLADLANRYYAAPPNACRVCAQTFLSKNELQKHLKKSKHNQKAEPRRTTSQPEFLALPSMYSELGGAALEHSNTTNPSDYCSNGSVTVTPNGANGREEDDVVVTPCVVCRRFFNTKKAFFAHLGGASHYRNSRFVLKRRAELDLDVSSKYLRT